MERGIMDKAFATFAGITSRVSGHPLSFVAATILILGWAIAGPIFHYSDTWQLVMNTVSSIITFLMVFVIQNSQDRNTDAIQLKLDELIRAVDGARNDLRGAEHLPPDQLAELKEQLASGPERSSE